MAKTEEEPLARGVLQVAQDVEDLVDIERQPNGQALGLGAQRDLLLDPDTLLGVET